MHCPHCGQEHPESTLFCPLTGQKMPRPDECPHCGRTVDPTWPFCVYCGNKLLDPDGMPPPAAILPQPATAAPAPPEPERQAARIPWLLLAGGIGVFLILAAAVVLFTLRQGRSQPAEAVPAAAAQPPASAVAAKAVATPLAPAAGRIAFASGRDGQDYEIYVMDADGGNLNRLTDNPTGDGVPVWSADGDRIAFISDRDGNFEIYTMNADGSAQTRLTDDPADDDVPAWSPDGQQIAFTSNRHKNYEIYTMNADGAAQRRLTYTEADDAAPTWSADGQQIAFMSARDGDFEIYVMNADGTSQTRLTANAAQDTAPDWSADGRKIVFMSDRDGDNEVYTMNAGGTAQTRLTNNPADDGFPTWSGDGQQILFHSDRDGNMEVYVMNADGSQPTRLTDNPADDGYADWAHSAPAATTAAMAAATPIPPSAAATNQTAPDAMDDYRPVEPAELRFELKGYAANSIVGEDGVARTVGGEVDELICEGQTIELVSHQFDGEFLETAQYGPIKFQFSSSVLSAGFSVWLTPQQKEAIIKALKPAAAGGTLTSSEAQFVGVITEWGPLGQFSPNFSGVFGGVEFKLQEVPGQVFQVVTDSFDEAAELGVMARNADGVFEFLDLTGWQVIVTCEESDDGTCRVTALERIN